MSDAIPPATASGAGLLVCGPCGTLVRRQPGRLSCPLCGAPLDRRKPNSLSRTWALLISAVLLYFPANLLPVMETASLLEDHKDTIIGGVVYFWTTGSTGLAVLIFSVSIVIPMVKMGILAYLALAVRSRSVPSRRQCMTMYRLIEFIGRWSMLDVFVVALMVGLVRFHSLAEVAAGPGASAFGAVVILTMLAARSFDPRLIWDKDSRADD
jgi:paraquat-inducible protein A